MEDLLERELLLFVANPGLRRFLREITALERDQGHPNSRVLVTLREDGLSHNYLCGCPSALTQILMKEANEG